MKKQSLKRVKKDDFHEIMTTPIRDIEYVLHQVVSLMKKMSRGEKMDEVIFRMMHEDIELIFRNFSLPRKVKRK